jgi:4-aminobutyrate aminotransferase
MTSLSRQQLEQLDDNLIADALKLRFYPLAAAEGEGCRVRDVEGRQYLDFSAGWALASAGYSHPIFKQRIAEQLERTTFSGLISGMNEPAVRLAERLTALAPGDFEKKCWFGFCGSDANETIGRLLPMATGRRRLISFSGSYHGFTAASMAMSGHLAFADFIGGGHVIKIPYPYPYRPPFGENPDETGLKALDFLENYVLTQMCPPDDIAGIIVEAVQSDGGVIAPTPDFLPGLAEICHKHGIRLILDEVKIGMGRTGQMFGFQHSDIVPDAIILGKALGGGLPLSAVIARREILDAGMTTALFTGVGNALCCTAGLATLEIIEGDQLISRAAETGAHLRRRLEELKSKHPMIGDVRGQGMIQGVELVSDPAAKTPAAAETAKVVYRAYELGLLLYYVGTFSNVLEITPPLIMTPAEVDEGIDMLDRALADVTNGRVSDEEVARYAGW